MKMNTMYAWSQCSIGYFMYSLVMTHETSSKSEYLSFEMKERLPLRF